MLTRMECKSLLTHQLSFKRRSLTSDQEMAAVMVLMRCSHPLYADLLLMEVQEWKSYLGSKPWEGAAPPSTLKGRQIWGATFTYTGGPVRLEGVYYVARCLTVVNS